MVNWNMNNERPLTAVIDLEISKEKNRKKERRKENFNHGIQMVYRNIYFCIWVNFVATYFPRSRSYHNNQDSRVNNS